MEYSNLWTLNANIADFGAPRLRKRPLHIRLYDYRTTATPNYSWDTIAMGIRIQPTEITVPQGDPFKNDCLGRKEPAVILTQIVGSLQGPCVLAVDAAWGAGKTTFLRIWSQYLRNNGFPVVDFNAWETDFSGDPFIALSTELTKGLQEHTDQRIATQVAELKKAAKKVVIRAVPSAIRLATGGILDVDPLLALREEAGQTSTSHFRDRLTDYLQTQKSVKEFRHIVQTMAETLSESSDNRPLVVVIDELDRCRPSYATELLEVAKHLFTVDHIVFVLAVNRSELAHSISALYGSRFDADGYLRRFFDVDFRLPDVNRSEFIDTLLHSTQIDDYFSSRIPGQAARTMEYYLLKEFFSGRDLSLRRIAQSIHRLGLVCASLGDQPPSFSMTAVVALVLRTVDVELYHQFRRREISDLEVIDEIFNHPRRRDLKDKDEGCYFEATIIMAWHEMSGSHVSVSTDLETPLLQQHRNILRQEAASGRSDNQNTSRSTYVVHLVEEFHRIALNGYRVTFPECVRRIELLSADLVNRSPN